MRKGNPLVHVTTPIEVGAGLHLFVAPNGSGKTTLLRSLAGLSRTLSGSPTVAGRVLYQSDELRVDPELTAKKLFRAMFKGRTYERALDLADRWKLSLSTSTGKCSRGNRQKVLLIMLEARLLGAGSSVVLMDEPLTGLDAEMRSAVVNCWADSCSDALRLVVLHELESVQQADSLFTISGGNLRHAQQSGSGSWLETYRSLSQ